MSNKSKKKLMNLHSHHSEEKCHNMIESGVDKLNTYQQSLDDVESHLKMLCSKPIDEITAGLSEFEVVQFKYTLAYALTTLQLCYSKSKGEKPIGQQYIHNLERIKALLPKFVDYLANNPNA